MEQKGLLGELSGNWPGRKTKLKNTYKQNNKSRVH